MPPTETQQENRLSVPSLIANGAEDEFDTRLHKLLRDSPSSVSLDCSALEQVASGHINLLWRAHLACAKAGVAMTLYQPSAGLVRVLRVLDLFHLFQPDDTDLTSRLREAVKPTLEPGDNFHTDEFAASPRDIERALTEFIAYLEPLKLPEITTFELRTAFYEVATNISSHGKVATDDKIVFSATVDDEKIVMVFADSGVCFNPVTMDREFDFQAAARGRQRRGFGLAMVGKLMDRMDYVRVHDAINLLTLEKRWSGD